jgi:hypothetical protein
MGNRRLGTNLLSLGWSEAGMTTPVARSPPNNAEC